MNACEPNNPNLKDVCLDLGVTEMPSMNPRITGITDDSRRVRPGDLFVAVKGTALDGRRFIEQAILAGAAAIASEGPAPDTKGVPWVRLDDDRSGAARLAAAYFGRPAERMKVVGITGTNGKTTSTYILESVLTTAMIPCGVLGTIRYSTGKATVDASLTTPGAIMLQAALAEMIESGMKACAMEVSSHALAQRRTDGMRFDAAVFTNVTQDHFDYHGDFENYRAAKALLLGRLKEGAAVILNAEDASADYFAERAPAHARVMRCGIDTPSFVDFRAEIRSMDASGTHLRIDAPDGRFDVKMRLFGRHNVENALGTIAAAWSLGVGSAAIAAGLAQPIRVPGRLERVEIPQGPVVVIDYAHTADAIEKIARTLRPMISGKLTILFGCGGDRDKSKRPLMGRAAESVADVVCLTTDNPRTESARAIIDDILQGFTNPAKAEIHLDRKEAIARMLDRAKPGDWLLLLGKGHETYQIIGQEKLPYSERQSVLDWSNARAREGAAAR